MRYALVGSLNVYKHKTINQLECIKIAAIFTQWQLSSGLTNEPFDFIDDSVNNVDVNDMVGSYSAKAKGYGRVIVEVSVTWSNDGITDKWYGTFKSLHMSMEKP